MTSNGAERLAKSNSLKGQSTKFAITGGISAVIDVVLTWLFQIVLELLATSARVPSASSSAHLPRICSTAAGLSAPSHPSAASPWWR